MFAIFCVFCYLWIIFLTLGVCRVFNSSNDPSSTQNQPFDSIGSKASSTKKVKQVQFTRNSTPYYNSCFPKKEQLLVVPVESIEQLFLAKSENPFIFVIDEDGWLKNSDGVLKFIQGNQPEFFVVLSAHMLGVKVSELVKLLNPREYNVQELGGGHVVFRLDR